MKKSAIFYLSAFFFLIFIVSGAVYYENKIKSNSLSSYGNTTTEIRLGGENFKVEIVSTPAKRELGLSGRPDLCRNCAMLFVFGRAGDYPFWMKDMRFDLDIIWIDGSSIKYIKRDASAVLGTREIINPGTMADKVIEINSGLSDALGIKVGDKVSF